MMATCQSGLLFCNLILTNASETSLKDVSISSFTALNSKELL